MAGQGALAGNGEPAGQGDLSEQAEPAGQRTWQGWMILAGQMPWAGQGLWADTFFDNSGMLGGVLFGDFAVSGRAGAPGRAGTMDSDRAGNRKRPPDGGS